MLGCSTRRFAMREERNPARFPRFICEFRHSTGRNLTAGASPPRRGGEADVSTAAVRGEGAPKPPRASASRSANQAQGGSSSPTAGPLLPEYRESPADFRLLSVSLLGF